MNAAEEWFGISGNADKAISPLVALGLDLARNFRFVAQSREVGCNTMGDLINAQLEDDGEMIRRSMELKAAASSSGPAA